MCGMTADELQEVVRRERLLLDPAIRADVGQVSQLLHANFVEFGRSGRVWDRESVLIAVAADPAVSGPAQDFAAVRLADGVVLLTYSVTGPEGSRRSSIWVLDAAAGWQLRFHQGTANPAAGAGYED